MSTGLKNAIEIISSIQDNIQFAVNEECVAGGNCDGYDNLINAGKPVFHIEYVTHNSSADGQLILNSQDIPSLSGASTEEIREVLCLERDVPNNQAKKSKEKINAKDFSTVIKGPLLDPWVYYCDSSNATTVTMDVGTGGPNSGYC
jgi:hypothetical protein